MSFTKRFIENEISRISNKSGYSESFLMDVFNEALDDGECDLKEIEAIAMEHDF